MEADRYTGMENEWNEILTVLTNTKQLLKQQLCMLDHIAVSLLQHQEIVAEKDTDPKIEEIRRDLNVCLARINNFMGKECVGEISGRWFARKEDVVFGIEQSMEKFMVFSKDTLEAIAEKENGCEYDDFGS